MARYPLIQIAMALLVFLCTAVHALPAAANSPAPARNLPFTPAPAPSAGGAGTGFFSATPDSNIVPPPLTLEAKDQDHPLPREDDFLILPDGAAGSSAGGLVLAGDPRATAEYPAPTWRWKRAGLADYLGVAVAGAGAIYVETAHGDPDPKWNGKNGFDESVRDAMRLHSRGAREVAHDVGDALMYGMIAAPVLDPFATLGIRDGAWDTLWQTEMVNLESFAFTSFVSSLLQNLVAREKPFVRNCQGGACEGDAPNRSMPSGHAAFAFTGAGLVCNHHHYQGLYRDPGADRAACWTGMGVAMADGVARIMADHHYATDVAAGAALGLFSGFLLPRLLHYRHSEPPGPAQTTTDPMIKQLSFRPLISDGGAGLACDMRF
jgi:membrane-associated phospholipid phosphatase